MSGNKNGFTLIEILVVVLIMITLVTIAVPQYTSAKQKTQITMHLPLMRALQQDIVNYFNLNGRLPDRLFQLSLNKAEFEEEHSQAAKHKETNCRIWLVSLPNEAGVGLDCNQGWDVIYYVSATNLGYAPSVRRFTVTDGSARLHKIAENLGWQKHGPMEWNIQ